uniref:Uncharacterized protein n=1 Tax=Manihot esculenta TaxID=3983 RepID=A0A2C9UQ81_MANES
MERLYDATGAGRISYLIVVRSLHLVLCIYNFSTRSCYILGIEACQTNTGWLICLRTDVNHLMASLPRYNSSIQFYQKVCADKILEISI